MRSTTVIHKFSCTVLLIISLLACTVGNAGHGGGYHGGNIDNRNDDNNRNYNHDDRGVEGSSAVIIGAPIGGDVEPAYPYSCQSVQQCDSDGNCIQTQNCN